MRGAAEIAELVGRGELDPVAVVEEALERIAGDADLNAIMVTNGERALGRARAGVSGRLAGVPLLVKDLIDVAGLRTSFGSKIYAERIAETTAPSVRALEAEGAIVVATTTCDEFAWGVSGQNTHWGDTQNPHRPGRVTGGSSSGNAAALAVGMGALALGTDTGGSVRIPAAACGVVGFKTPFGAITTEGVFPLVPALDTVGPMARSVEDCALAWSVLTGEPVPEPRLEGKRIGKLTRFPSTGERRARAARPARRRPSGRGGRAAGARGGRVAGLLRRRRGVAPRDLPGARGRLRPVDPRQARARGAHDARGRIGARTRRWRHGSARRRRTRRSTSSSRRCSGSPQLPDIDTPEHEFRIPFSAYARPFNFLGWPAIAIGETQLAARDPRTLLEAALAWGP